MSGFIALYRSVCDHHLFNKDTNRLGAWVWLVANAAWKDTSFNIRGQTIVIERGQICVSIRQLANEWGWSKSAVERFLTRLETETMIERNAGHGRLVLTVCNYARYQDIGVPDRDTSGTPTETKAGHQRDTKEQGNKETNKPITSDGDFASSDAALLDHRAIVFSGRVVRLNQRDFDKWSEIYSAIPDLRAELTALDDWLRDESEGNRKRWFQIVSGSLAKKHRALLQEAARSNTDDEWRYHGP